MTDVVAALIWDGDRFLACQRPARKKRGLLWEFVGGKVEQNETPQQALIRECKEELDITVTPQDIFMELIHEYPDMTVRLILFNAVISKGTPRMLEHNDIRWITTAEIDNYSFCPADKDILAVLKGISNHLQATLFAMRDPNYKRFQCALMPGVEEASVIGVRMPELRRLSKAVSSIEQLGSLPHLYYEENCIHGILINQTKDFDHTVRLLDEFLPFVNNWAVCDLLSPKAFRKCPPELLEHVRRWMSSDHTYTVRFAIGVLMKYYLDDAFSPVHMKMVADVRSQEYYVKMMVAWYFSTALAKQYDFAIKFLTEQRLDPWTHNKTIQKACESYRIDPEKKAYLRTLRVRKEK